MSNVDFRFLVDVKCIPCCFFQSCKIRDGFLLYANSDRKIDKNVIQKVSNCMFFREL